MWIYKGREFKLEDGKIVAFVYIITNNIDGRKYIGKKNIWATKTKQVNGKKKRFKVPSDWINYWSSSEELKSDIEEYGKENFSREILHLCKSRGTANYYEAYEQFSRGVLENQEKWYNRHIQCRVHFSHIKK